MQNQTLARDDNLMALEPLLLDSLPHKGQLFEPLTSFYEQFSNDTKLADLARELYRWLGIKPHRLRVDYSGNCSDDSTISLQPDDRTMPYRAAARLCLEVTKRALEQRAGEPVSVELYETATIEAGLGLVILNGLTDHPSLLQYWHNGLRSYHTEDLHLSTYTPVSYARALGDFTHHYRLPGDQVMQRLSRDAQRVMPAYYQHYSVVPRRLPHQLAERRRQTRNLFLKTAGIGLLSGSVVTLGCYIYSQRPYQPSAAVIDQYEKVSLLAKTYDICKKAVLQERNQADLNDIFSDQRINAHLVRCQSLRNQYNYQVGIYNVMVQGQETTISAK